MTLPGKMSVSSHGNISFDKKYYRRFHTQYNEKELQIYYRWFIGWINFLEKQLPELKNRHSKKTLEIGCSIGAFSKILQERGLEVTSTDISEFIINKARNLQKDVKFLVFDVEKGGKVGNNFDYIFAFEVVEHLKNPESALIHVNKLLNKGGTFIFSTPFPSQQSLADPTHISVHEASMWLQLGKKVGFRKRRHIYASFIPYFYRFHKLFSFGFPMKINLPYINSTCFFLFQK